MGCLAWHKGHARKGSHMHLAPGDGCDGCSIRPSSQGLPARIPRYLPIRLLRRMLNLPLHHPSLQCIIHAPLVELRIDGVAVLALVFFPSAVAADTEVWTLVALDYIPHPVVVLEVGFALGLGTFGALEDFEVPFGFGLSLLIHLADGWKTLLRGLERTILVRLYCSLMLLCFL